MRKFLYWSIRYKLLSLLLLLSVTTFAVTGTIAYIKYQAALKRDVTNQLIGVTRSKRSQIESYYRTVHNHVETLSEDRMFIDAMREFRAAYRKLNKKPVPAETLEAVREDYQNNFYPEMQKLGIARQSFQAYLPVTPAAIQLQYLYIVKNPNPKGQRYKLANAGDGSDYSKVHEKYNAAFQQIVQKFGYYDLYLIDYDTGNIVYDFAKDRDWGTNLKYGPYSNSNLAKVVKQCMATDNPNDVFFSDFEPYEASMGEPTQYVASPIFDGKERLGIFAFQLSVAAIDNVMNGNRGWTRDGLGRTGEALIFGSQRRPRSDFRLYLEDPERFLAEQKAQGAPDDVLERIRTFKTTILQLPIDSPAVDLALSGKQGSMIEVHRAGLANFLVSYMPVQIEGLHWAIIARMSTREAFAPMREMRWLFSWWGSGLLVVTVLAALFVTRQILRPVNALVGAAKKVASGDLTAQVAWNSHDELGVLSDTFNSMTRSIREKTELIQEKNRENEALLLNILPCEIAARLKGGEHEIADNFADMGIGLGLLFFVLKGANHLWTSLEGPSIMTQYVTPVICCFFPGFAALSIPWPLTNWYLRRVGRWEEADGIEDASDSKGGMDSIRIMKWLNIGLVSPIALFTLLAIPIHLSIGDSEVRIGHYASFHTERFPLNEAKRLTMVDGYRLKDGSFRLAKDVIIDFADGRRLRGNQVGDGGSSVRDDVMQLLIAKTGLTPQHALKADDIPVLRAER